MKEKIKKIKYHLFFTVSPYGLLCLILFIWLGFSAFIWGYSFIIFILYIPIGITSGLKFYELFMKYCENLEKKQKELHQKALKEVMVVTKTAIDEKMKEIF